MSQLVAPLSETRVEGVRRVDLPTPFPVGPVACYVLVDHPVTVIDPGMVYLDTPALLTEALASVGRELSEIEQIVVTHAHPDHFGAAGWLAQVSDAPIVCGAPEVEKLTGASLLSRVTGLTERLGFPEDIRGSFNGFHETVDGLLHPIPDHTVVAAGDGAEVEAGGRRWQINLTPGHAAGHISLFDPDQRVLLGGDHLLARITPNPVIEPDPGSPLGRRRSLVEYLESLGRFVALDPEVVLPGHGPAFTDTPTWAGCVRRHHESRAVAILEGVGQIGPATAFELSRRMFPSIEGFAHLLGVSEVLGHLDLLIDDGLVDWMPGLPDRFQIRS